MRCFRSSVPTIILFGACALATQTIAASIAQSDAPCLAEGPVVSGSSLLQTQSSSYGKPDTCRSAFADKQSKATSLLEYQPHMRGGETHSDLREVLKQMQPGLAKEIVELASPGPEVSNLLAEAEDYEGIGIASTKRDAAGLLQREPMGSVCHVRGARNEVAASCRHMVGALFRRQRL